jgi:hypothetical protein
MRWETVVPRTRLLSVITGICERRILTKTSFDVYL